MSDPLPSPRMAFTVAYDGTDFQGWQGQPGLRTVQGEIETSMSRIADGVFARVHGSGRTDAGVHARGQVFHVDSPRPAFPPDKWAHALNGTLPPDIRIVEAKAVAPDFHARFDAIGKEYRYFVYNAPVLPPEMRRTRLHLRQPLSLDALREAAEVLLGTHDFKSFSANRGFPETSTVRTLRRLEWQVDGPEFCLRVEADGFLYKMVRQLTGALLRAGRGELSAADLHRMLDQPLRDHRAPTLPPQGLFLWRVMYKED